MKKSIYNLLLVAFGISLIVSGLNTFVPKVSAAYAPDFQAGNIIGDALFFDSGSMSVSQVQQFMNQQEPNCDTYGTQTSEYGGGTRAQYGASRGYPAPYICLRNYYENPTTLANNLGGITPDGAISAAQIISNAATAYGISPKALLATLQKESALVTDSWPFPSQYKAAMGYGCPDTAPCDSQYYGFYNQVTNAAKQFQRYATSASLFRYKAGQNNTIQYNPSTSCGSSSVFVQNQATAGLYNYTPYQPNASALSNLYGTGDGCSAYGNRNFWRIYTDWFGSTSGSDLVRTVNSATVYLISGAYRYPIADGSVLGDFSPLGKILYVSDSYVSAHALGSQLGHIVGANDGTLYFVNAGIKLPFSSCSVVAAYGYSCSSIIYLTDVQLSALSTGPYASSLYGTTSGKLFNITAGTKREVFDHQSLINAGLTDGQNVLLEAGIDYLPYGQPIIRDGVVSKDRQSGQSLYYEANHFVPLANDMAGTAALANFANGDLDDSSIPQQQKTAEFNGFFSNTTGSMHYVLLANGMAPLNDATAWASSYTPLSDVFISAVPTLNLDVSSKLVKSSDNSTVYYMLAGKKRPIASWGDLLGLHLPQNTITTLLPAQSSRIATGSLLFAPGHLLKTSGSASVYVEKSFSELLPLTSFLFTREDGISSPLTTISDTDFNAYTLTSPLQTKLVCNGVDYIGTNGQMFIMDSSALASYGFSQTQFVDAGALCTNLPLSSTKFDSFIRTNDGTIYKISGGTKQPIASYSTYLSLGGSSSNTLQVSDYFASSVTDGQILR